MSTAATSRPAWQPWIRPALIVAALLIALATAAWLQPQRALTQVAGRIDLQAQIPARFGRWREIGGTAPILPNPEIQQKLAKTYAQTVARTYVDGSGRSVMLTAAYGADQTGELTQVHRPEICYRAQGFSVRALRDDRLAFADHSMPVRRVLAQRGERNEPLSYWVTVGDQAVLPGIGRKLEQLRLGLGGWLADGMLIRVSSIDADQDRAFALQDQFLHELAAHMEPAIRGRYFGR